MRLIDADALHTVLVKMNDFGELSAKKAIRMVDKAPTVDAIPVDWIEETMHLAETVGAKEYAEHLEVLLADWAEREEE